jgi:hypothetical protein
LAIKEGVAEACISFIKNESNAVITMSVYYSAFGCLECCASMSSGRQKILDSGMLPQIIETTQKFTPPQFLHRINDGDVMMLRYLNVAILAQFLYDGDTNYHVSLLN